MGTRRGIAIMLSAAAVAVAAGAGIGATTDETAVPAAAAAVDPPHRTVEVPEDAPPWLAGLLARSDALNRLYELGDYAPDAKPDDEQAGEKARSAALNRAYGLGD